MSTVLGGVKIYFRFLKRLFVVGKLSGGIHALDRRLGEWEEELLSYPTSRQCLRCGSFDLEPTASERMATGYEIVKYRCKACGSEAPIDRPH